MVPIFSVASDCRLYTLAVPVLDAVATDIGYPVFWKPIAARLACKDVTLQLPPTMTAPDHPFPLLTLPGELIYATAEHLSLTDLVSLLDSTPSMNALLTPILHRIASDYKDDALIWAMENVHEQLLRLAVECGADVNLTTDRERTALTLAASVGWTDTVSFLLDRAADIEYREVWAMETEDMVGSTPLLFAVGYKREETAELLIARGANMYAENDGSFTVFMLAAKHGLHTVIQSMLDKGYDIHFRPETYTRTALHLAVWNRHIGVVKLLLKNGIDVHPQTSLNRTVLDLAMESQADIEMVQLLLDYGVDINAQTYSRTPLYVAVSNQSTSIVDLLLSRGADPNIPTNKGETALFHAVQLADESLTRTLLVHGANPNATTSNGTPTLHYALSSPLLVSLLLDHGVDINQQAFGSSALHTVIRARPQHLQLEDMCRLLLDRGIDIHGQDIDGKTALHLAVEWPTEKGIVEILLERGADVNVVDNKGDTPAQAALISDGTLEMRMLVLQAKGRKQVQRKVRNLKFRMPKVV